MLTFINHGLEQHVLGASEGIEGMRVDVPQTGALTDFVAPLVDSPMRYFAFILHDIARNEILLDAFRDTGFDTSRALIEPFNEREQGRVTPQIMIEGVNAIYRDCEARGFEGRIVVSGDSNLNTDVFRRDDALDFYRAVVPEVPTDTVIAFHDYPWRDQLHYRPWPPHRTHEQDIEAFLHIAGNHDCACSEFGFHMAMELLADGTEVRLSEQAVYDRLMEYLRRYDAYNLMFAAIYQWGDGTTDDAMGRFGLHDVNNQPKRQLDAVRDWKV